MVIANLPYIRAEGFASTASQQNNGFENVREGLQDLDLYAKYRFYSKKMSSGSLDFMASAGVEFPVGAYRVDEGLQSIIAIGNRSTDINGLGIVSYQHNSGFFATAQVFKTPELSYLVEAVVYAGLGNALSDPNANFTVFAPTDQAFINLGAALGLTFTEPADVRQLDRDLVTAVLLNHVFADVSADKFTPELSAGTFDSLGDDDIRLGAYTNGVLSVSGSGNSSPANMVILDVQTTNGIVHVIDQVLLSN